MDTENLLWKDGKEEELYQAHVFSLCRRKRSSTTGHTGDFYYLDSPDWVHVLAPLIHKGRPCFLGVLQERAGSRELSLEFPGGILEEGESIDTCAKRELLEECGYSAEQVLPVGHVYSNPALLNNCCHILFAEGVRYVGEQETDPGEILQTRYIPIDELRQGQYPKYFTHALMFSALALYFGWEKKEGADRI